MVKHDREFEILLKEFLKTEGKHFSSKEEATEVFEHIYNLVDAGYEWMLLLAILLMRLMKET